MMMGKRQHIIISLLIIMLMMSGCISGKSDMTKSTVTPDSAEIDEKSQSFAEEIGKDETGAAIIRQRIEDDESIIEIITIMTLTVTGKILLTGDAMFNELILLSADQVAYTFKPEYKDEYWLKQEKTLTIRGKVEKRSVKNKKTGRMLNKNWIFPAAIVEER